MLCSSKLKYDQYNTNKYDKNTRCWDGDGGMEKV